MDPKTTGVAGWFVIALALGPDPESLVSLLGSPRYAEREAASVALEKLGEDAFPILKSARQDRDPEVKSRAEFLLDSIERSMLTRPATLKLGEGRRSLLDVVEEVSKAEGVPIRLDDARPATARTFQVRKGETYTFWPLIDRLGLVPRWDFEPEFGRQAFRRPQSLHLENRTGPAPETSDYGPFRVVARPPSLAREAQPFDGGFRAPGIGRVPRTNRDLDLVVPIEVMAEPRLTLKASGPIQILEAVDDLGQSLASSARGGTDANMTLIQGDRTASVLSLQIRLKPLPRQGRTLAQLRCVVPVEVEARKIEPTAIPLVASPGEHRPVICGGTTILVHSLTPSESPRGGYQLELTIRREGERIGRLNGRFANQRMIEFVNDSEPIWQNTEIVDAQGRPYRFGTPRAVAPDGINGVRVVLPIPPREDGASPPSELLFHGQIRATVNVPFDFRDLRMP